MMQYSERNELCIKLFTHHRSALKCWYTYWWRGDECCLTLHPLITFARCRESVWYPMLVMSEEWFKFLSSSISGIESALREIGQIFTLSGYGYSHRVNTVICTRNMLLFIPWEWSHSVEVNKWRSPTLCMMQNKHKALFVCFFPYANLGWEIRMVY